MSEVWPDTYNEGCIHQFHHWQQKKHRILRYPTMEHLSNDHKDHPNQHKNSQKLCDEMDPVLSLLKSQWKLRQQHDQNFPMEVKPL